MTSVFDEYSRYYDLLYRDKDYRGETEYLAGVLRRFHKDPRHILELGSGTGRHGRLLAEAGFQVTGVERSSTMLAAASARSIDIPGGGRFSVCQGDARTVRLETRSDVVAALFHVASYQTKNSDLLALFDTAAAHLNPGGLFVFDVWYGPAVLSQGCQVRIRRMADDNFHVLRIAEPSLHTDQNYVSVKYSIQVRHIVSGEMREIEEQHLMRYLFNPEVELLCQLKGFKRVHSEEWMTAHKPSASTWGVLHVLEKM